VIVFVPDCVNVFEKLAVPALNATVPTRLPFWKNCMLPVGTEGPLEVTVAVNVTFSPTFEGFELEVTVVVVG
jgi:hypothetical protein